MLVSAAAACICVCKSHRFSLRHHLNSRSCSGSHEVAAEHCHLVVAAVLQCIQQRKQQRLQVAASVRHLCSALAPQQAADRVACVPRHLAIASPQRLLQPLRGFLEPGRRMAPAARAGLLCMRALWVWAAGCAAIICAWSSNDVPHSAHRIGAHLITAVACRNGSCASEPKRTSGRAPSFAAEQF